MSNPFFGIGIDSFGDFYRQYRDSIAVERTGPQRVTNTAHNVFLDISSGSGVLAGLSFIFILSIVFIYFAKTLFRKNEELDVDFLAWSSIVLGFMVFCMISINQIGVGVWGFVASGLLLSHERIKRTNSKSESRIKSLIHSHKQKPVGTVKSRFSNVSNSAIALRLRIGITALLSTSVLVISAAPNITDSKFLTVIKARDLDQAIELSHRMTAMDFHREVTIRNLSESGRSQEALMLAQEGINGNPRNWAFWVAIIFNEYSSESEKKSAVENLYALDPKNNEVRAELGDLIAKLNQK